jgi:cell division protein FtsQ
VTPVAAPADRRFRRAHVKPGRRRRLWRAFGWPAVKYALLMGGAAYLAIRGSEVTRRATFLEVDRIEVRGNERLSPADVETLLAGLKGQNIIRADLADWQRRLKASPWIRDAVLKRALPSTVEVIIAEREPVAIGRIKGDLYLIDDHGGVIAPYGTQYAGLDLPLVDGLTSRDDGGVRGALAARVIRALRSHEQLSSRLSQIDVSDARNAAVILSGDRAVLFVGDDRFLPRLQSYLDLATALRERVPDIDYVDLRFEDRIYVRPVGGRRRALPVHAAGTAGR